MFEFCVTLAIIILIRAISPGLINEEWFFEYVIAGKLCFNFVCASGQNCYLYVKLPVWFCMACNFHHKIFFWLHQSSEYPVFVHVYNVTDQMFLSFWLRFSAKCFTSGADSLSNH